MSIISRIKKIETTLHIISDFCLCREQGIVKKGIKADSFQKLMDELYAGICDVCAKPHVPPGYSFGTAWIESSKKIDSEGLRAVNAELAASPSFPNVMHIKSCRNCGESFANLKGTCKLAMSLPGTCDFLEEKLLGKKSDEH